jgi:hypothetical protein
MFFFLAFTGSALTPCEMCQEIVHYIEEYVIEGYVEKEILAFVNAYCEMLPTPLNVLCETFMDQNIDNILTWIAERLDSLNISGRIGLCDADARPIPLSIRARKD